MDIERAINTIASLNTNEYNKALESIRNLRNQKFEEKYR